MARDIDPEARQFGLRLKAIRVESDRDVDEIAKELGISAPSWYAYENGRTTFSYTLLPGVAKALRVPLLHLAERLYRVHDRDAASRFDLGAVARSLVGTAPGLVGA